jgi:RND family efflux transporter MFP subunit
MVMRHSTFTAAALVLAACNGSPSTPTAPPQRVAPETVQLQARREPKALAFFGTLISPRDASVGSTRGGRVDSFQVEVGQRVTRGQILARLGAGELAYASQAAAASVTQVAARLADIRDPASMPSALAAKSALEVATDARVRTEALHAAGSASDQELTRVRTQESTARAQYQQALVDARVEFGRLRETQALAGQARAALDDKDVRAPFDGLVLERFVEVGQMAAPQAPLFRIVDASEMRVRFEVSQFDADKVALGRNVRALVNGRSLRATVVRSTPGLVGDGRTRQVEAKFESTSDLTLLGARVPTWLELDETEELVEVPSAALSHTAGVARAWVLDGARLDERLLSVARVEEAVTLVRAGVRAGEALVKNPSADFRVGEEVAR